VRREPNQSTSAIIGKIPSFPLGIFMTSRRRTLITGSFLGIAQNVIRMATRLISIPLTLGYLGKERYGLWMITLTTLAFVSFLDVGLMPTIKNKMAEAYGKQEWERFRYYSSGGFLLGLCIFGIGLALAFFLPILDWSTVFEISDSSARQEALPLVVVVFLVGVTTVAFSGIDNIYVARMQIAKIQVYAILSSLVGFAMLLLGIELKVSLPLLALLTSCPVILYRFVLLIELYVSEKELIVPRLLLFPKLLRETLPLSIAFWGIKASELVLAMLPNLIIVKCLNLSNVATFSVASRLATIPLSIVTAVLPVFWPVFTIAWSRGEKGWLRKRLALLSGTTFLVLSIYTIIITLLGPWIIQLWTQNRISVSSEVLMGLGILVAVQASVYWLSTFLHSISDFRFEFFCHALSALILAATAWILTLWYGLFGLAIAMSTSWVIGCLIPMMYRVRVRLSHVTPD
jgi:O-antigen/teichoic acid export membrane protein